MASQRASVFRLPSLTAKSLSGEVLRAKWKGRRRSGIDGLGLKKTLRALVAELVYGTPASTHDPARFAFAHNGKDGTLFPLDRETYDRTIETLNAALNSRGIDRGERVPA
jgi:hypothetical protein